MNDQHSKAEESELDFRIRFKNDYGIDYQEALDEIKRKQETRNQWWHNMCVVYGWNK
jgi:hypothetical protein